MLTYGEREREEKRKRETGEKGKKKEITLQGDMEDKRR